MVKIDKSDITKLKAVLNKEKEKNMIMQEKDELLRQIKKEKSKRTLISRMKKKLFGGEEY